MSYATKAADRKLGVWLKWWSDIDGGQLPLYLSVFLTIPIVNLVAIGLCVVGKPTESQPRKLLNLGRCFQILIAPISSNKLHYILLNTVMRAPQSFFSETDTGKILNMFSQDMTLIEGPCPQVPVSLY